MLIHSFILPHILKNLNIEQQFLLRLVSKELRDNIFSNMITLNITPCFIRDENIYLIEQYVSQMQNLKYIKLENIYISIDGINILMEIFTKLPNLISFALYHIKIIDENNVSWCDWKLLNNYINLLKSLKSFNIEHHLAELDHLTEKGVIFG